VKAGIGTYTYMWSIGFEGARPARPLRALGVVERARALGVEVVQFGPNLALYELPHAELAEVLAACRQFGIELEVGTRGVDPSHLLRMLEFTSGCGSTLLRTTSELTGETVRTACDLASALRAVEPAFRQAGVRLAVENSLMPAAAMDEALRAAGSEFLGVTLDTVNSLAIPEGTEEVVGRLAKWTHCLHVKDFVVRREWHFMGFRVEGRPAGQGQLNVPLLLRRLREAGARANAILELWPPPQATPAETIALEERWAEESVLYLKRVIREES
jgi:sugar phosphate isomerase/epimerase